MPDTTRLQMSTEPLCPAFLEDDDAGNTNGFYKYTYTYLHVHVTVILWRLMVHVYLPVHEENIMQPECIDLNALRFLWPKKSLDRSYKVRLIQEYKALHTSIQIWKSSRLNMTCSLLLDVTWCIAPLQHTYGTINHQITPRLITEVGWHHQIWWRYIYR